MDRESVSQPPTGPAVVQSVESSTECPSSRFAQRKLLCTLVAHGACKILRGCDVLHPIYASGGTKRRSHPLRGGSKLQCHVSGLSFRMNSGPSAKAHQCSSIPTLNPINLNLNLGHLRLDVFNGRPYRPHWKKYSVTVIQNVDCGYRKNSSMSSP